MLTIENESLLFRLAVAVVGLHVIDDNFVQPGARHRVARPPGQRPRAARAAGAGGLGVPAGPGRLRGTMALALCSPALLSGVEAIHYGSRSGLSGDDFTGLLAMAAAPVLLGLGVATLWRSRRLGDRLYRRYPRRVLKLAAGIVAGVDLAMPVAIAYVGSHSGARRGARGPARRRIRGRDLRDQRRARARGLVRAVAQRRRRDRVPRPQRHPQPGAHARPQRVRRAALRPPRRGRQRGRPERLGLGLRQGHPGRHRLPEAAAGRGSGRIGGLGLSVGGEMLLQTAAETRTSPRWSPRARAPARLGEEVGDVEGIEKVGDRS